MQSTSMMKHTAVKYNFNAGPQVQGETSFQFAIMFQCAGANKLLIRSVNLRRTKALLII